MEEDQWHRVQHLFEVCLQRNALEREAYLALACGGDAAPFSEVHSLLEADAQASGLFQQFDIGGMPLPTPRVFDEQQDFGPYRILSWLGAGGMGVVYKALDTRLERNVALKFLTPHLSQNEKAKQRLIVEACAASSRDHPNICTLYDIGETADGHLYISMAYYSGHTLEEKLSEGALAITEALHIATQVAEGLTVAHSQGIFHRDIKPANIILTDGGLARIVDFGIAKMLSTDITVTDQRIGTVAYMSPEQLRGEKTGHGADVWPLGVMLYEMVAGRRPFQRRTRKILARYLDVVERVVRQYGGSVQQKITDMVTTLFGIPSAHDDDAERAVRAALEVHRLVAELGESLGDSLGSPLQVHIGIASGQLVVNADTEGGFLVTGKALKLARRLGDMAGSQETLVSEAVSHAVEKLVATEVHGELVLRGGKAPLPVSRVIGFKTTAMRPRPKPLLGRRSELQESPDVIENCQDGAQGQVDYLHGEAGIDKNRLTVDVAQPVATGPTTPGSLSKCLMPLDPAAPCPAVPEVERRQSNLMESTLLTNDASSRRAVPENASAQGEPMGESEVSDGIVGRPRELEQFRQLLKDGLAEHAGSVLFMRGVAGIGKSRLLQEFERITASFGV